MILKVYKKRTRWYFTYHLVEKQIPENLANFIENLCKLLEQDFIYFKIEVNPGSKTYGLALLYDNVVNRNTITYCLYGRLISDLPTLIGFDRHWCTINLPSAWVDDGNANLYISIK